MNKRFVNAIKGLTADDITLEGVVGLAAGGIVVVAGAVAPMYEPTNALQFMDDVNRVGMSNIIDWFFSDECELAPMDEDSAQTLKLPTTPEFLKFGGKFLSTEIAAD